MADINSSKIYKFKLSEVSVTVTIDNSYYFGDTASNTQFSAEWLHDHAVNELFVTEDEPIIIDTVGGVREYQNSAICIPPFFEHRAIRKKDYRILFSYAAAEHSDSDFSFFMNSICNPDICVLRINNSVSFYTAELNELLKAELNVSDEVVSAVLKMLFYSLFRENFNIEKKRYSGADESCLVKIDNILAKCDSDISIGCVAQKLGFSRRQTSRIIMKYYKTTLSKLVTQRRLNVARSMLLSGEYTVSEIVEKVNFTSESYFYSQFKKRFGVTPLKYKRMNCKER